MFSKATGDWYQPSTRFFKRPRAELLTLSVTGADQGDWPLGCHPRTGIFNVEWGMSRVRGPVRFTAAKTFKVIVGFVCRAQLRC